MMSNKVMITSQLSISKINTGVWHTCATAGVPVLNKNVYQRDLDNRN